MPTTARRPPPPLHPLTLAALVQFGKDISEGKYDYTAEGKQQLLLPSEYKKAVAAKSPAPVISWHPHVIAACWKVACRLIVKLDAEKKVSRDCMDWVDSEVTAHDTVRPPPPLDAVAGWSCCAHTPPRCSNPPHPRCCVTLQAVWRTKRR